MPHPTGQTKPEATFDRYWFRRFLGSKMDDEAADSIFSRLGDTAGGWDQVQGADIAPER
jgi:hypothetical protein